MDDSPHLSDLHLCQQCLEGEAAALDLLRTKLTAKTAAYLIGTGASPDEATEVVDSLWADLLAPGDKCPPRLARYRGTSALQTWLNTVALNKLITRKRAEQRWHQLTPARVGVATGDEGGEEESSPAWLADPESAQADDTLLIELMREAIEKAFLSCDPEDFVLLQLKHCDGLRGAELGVMFGCDESVISRRLSKAEEHIQAATLLHIRKTDPWLELKWADFVELCRTAVPACFGLD